MLYSTGLRSYSSSAASLKGVRSRYSKCYLRSLRREAASTQQLQQRNSNDSQLRGTEGNDRMRDAAVNLQPCTVSGQCNEVTQGRLGFGCYSLSSLDIYSRGMTVIWSLEKEPRTQCFPKYKPGHAVSYHQVSVRQ